jgi:hypothetical protein
MQIPARQRPGRSMVVFTRLWARILINLPQSTRYCPTVKEVSLPRDRGPLRHEKEAFLRHSASPEGRVILRGHAAETSDVLLCLTADEVVDALGEPTDQHAQAEAIAAGGVVRASDLVWTSSHGSQSATTESDLSRTVRYSVLYLKWRISSQLERILSKRSCADRLDLSSPTASYY